MILKENEFANVCVRGLVIEQNHLVVTEWTDREEQFLIGGRVEFGEPLAEVAVREVYEETGVETRIKRLLYFNENIFTFHDGRKFHEYGWYFLMESPVEICPNGRSFPNPDSPYLIIRRLPITPHGMRNLWPRFLATYLPQDLADGFQACPRALFSDEKNVLTDYSHILMGSNLIGFDG